LATLGLNDVGSPPKLARLGETVTVITVRIKAYVEAWMKQHGVAS